MRKKIIGAVLIGVGFVSLGVGVIGIFLPILPTTPFFMLTLVCFAKGSKKFERWFVSTKLYTKYLEAFIKTRAMTNASKVKVLIMITALISIPFILVDVLPMRIVLAAVIAFHYVYFIFRVKSVSKARLKELLAEVKAKEASASATSTQEEKEGVLADSEIENGTTASMLIQNEKTDEQINPEKEGKTI